MGNDNSALRFCINLYVRNQLKFNDFRTHTVGGIAGIIILDLIFLLPLVNSLRMFMLCTYTEPGIIPKVRSTKIDYNKTHYVAYRNGDEPDSLTHNQALDAGQIFFSLYKFKLGAV